MTVFSTVIRNLAFGLLLSTCALPALAYNGDDDRAASRAVTAEKAEPAKQASEKQKPAKPRHTSSTAGHVNLTKIESFGLLNGPRDGGFGIDMWDGTDRATAVEFIKKLPSSFHYRMARDLARRVLMTAADVSMLEHKDAAPAEPGKDLFSLRLQKLLEMGQVEDAARLYKENPYGPYDGQMASLGVLALMFDGQGALACLETEAMHDKFTGVHMWEQLTAICDYKLETMAGSKTVAKRTMGPFPAGDSAVVRSAMDNPNYRFTGSAKEFESLTSLEQAFLAIDGRIDYSRFRRLNAATLAPSVLALLIHDPNAPLDFRFQLMLTGIGEGIISAKELGEFYKSIPFTNLADEASKLDGIREASGWQRLAWLYRSADKSRGTIDNEVLRIALPLRSEYGLEALAPFAFMLANAKPDGQSDETIRTGILLGLVMNTQISDAWAQHWKRKDSSLPQDVLLQICYEIGRESLSKGGANYNKLLSEIRVLPIQQQELIKIFSEKLDNGGKLHNIEAVKVYENTVDLTQNAGYVMPSVGLIESLATAVNDKHLGEAVLLSSVALHETSPDKIAGTLKEVANGLETVGLTKESRGLAVEAILGAGK